MEHIPQELEESRFIFNLEDQTFCREIKYALQNTTTDAYYACSVSNGIERFMEQEYCLVIMDIALAEADGQELNLTRKEFDLLFCLASHAGQVLSREQLYSQVWNNENAYDIDEAVKSQIKTLRKKMTDYNREYVKNVWGIGCRFVDESKNK